MINPIPNLSSALDKTTQWWFTDNTNCKTCTAHQSKTSYPSKKMTTNPWSTNRECWTKSKTRSARRSKSWPKPMPKTPTCTNRPMTGVSTRWWPNPRRKCQLTTKTGSQTGGRRVSLRVWQKVNSKEGKGILH